MTDVPRAGDLVTDAQFTAVFEEHADRVFRYCLLRLRSHADAEDLTAEVFASLLKTGRPPAADRALPWLLRVAHNACVDHARRAARDEALPARLPAAHHISPAAERDDDVWAAVRTLPLLQQQVLYLRAVEDLSHARIATLLGKREGTVRVACHRALRELRSELAGGVPDALES